MKGSLYLVPNGIRPVMQRTAVEVCSLVVVVCLIVKRWQQIAFTSSGELNLCRYLGGREEGRHKFLNNKVSNVAKETMRLIWSVKLNKG